MYVVNDSTIGFTINNQERTIKVRGADPSKVPLSRTITINGTTQDLSENRTWTITKSDVGLGNVDNTSDLNKPVSTAQQNTIDDTASALRSAIAANTTTASNGAQKIGNDVQLGGALTGNTTINSSGNYLRVQNGIGYTQIIGARTVLQPDSTNLPYYARTINSPFGGNGSDGILTWYEGITSNPQSPSRPNYPYMMGWNLHPGGTAAVPGLPAIGMSFEPHYKPTPTSPTPWLQEAHLYYITPQNKQVRLWSSTVNTSTNDYDFYFTTRTFSMRDSSLRTFLAVTQNLGNQAMSMELGSSATHKNTITVDPTSNITSITTVGTSKATAGLSFADFGGGVTINAGGLKVTSGNITVNGNVLPQSGSTWQIGGPSAGARWLKVNTDQLNGARNVIGNIASWGSTAGIYPLAIVPENATAANTAIRMYTSTIGLTSLFELKNNGNIKLNPVTTDAAARDWLDVNGSAIIDSAVRTGTIGTRIRTVTSNTTIDKNDHTILIDASSGNITVTLPTAAAAFTSPFGLEYVFVRVDNVLANTVTITRTGSDTINGSASFTLTALYQSKTVQSAGGTTYFITQN
jgi:hypothetical protein